MYRRLIILSLIIVVALGGLSWLGYRAVSVWSQGIEGTRITEFANVAEQIRADVNDKLDDFMKREQARPYTDYQYYTIADEPLPANQEMQANERTVGSDYYYRSNQTLRDQGNILNGSNQQQVAVKVSPLADNIEHGLAYFNFQYDPNSKTLTSPNGFIEQQQSQATPNYEEKLNELVENNSKNVLANLVPTIEKFESKELTDSLKKRLDSAEDMKQDSVESSVSELFEKMKVTEEESARKVSANSKSLSKGSTSNRTASYDIKSLQNPRVEPQIQTQSRNSYNMNNSAGMNELANAGQQAEIINNYQQMPQQEQPADSREGLRLRQSTDAQAEERQQIQQQSTSTGGFGGHAAQRPGLDTNQAPVISGARRAPDQVTSPDPNQFDIVEARIERFRPYIISGENDKDSIFGGQVFMVRRVKIEEKELLQGFQLNEDKLMEEVERSTKRFVREGMSYELGRKQNANSAYTAILDFGFGHLLVNLFENDPGRIAAQISHLRMWYFSIVSIVFLAVTLAVASLWMNAREQITLAQKKDDFVSAVSHELRTPLTSIRMHAEMLEKNWIKSENKLGEYYRSMRQESERLSRLIENVLDFSRIQKGRKKYVFKLGDINKCVLGVVEMMSAYAAQKGFRIKQELGECREIAFDSDAVTQIVVNLLDNAVKYSANSEDKIITVRTRSDDEFVLIEVEDHGPGIPHRQRKRIFQEFYRIGAEATRETSGSGLGLALVKRFAQAHNGFVEILSARPTGAIFRVSLAAKSHE